MSAPSPAVTGRPLPSPRVTPAWAAELEYWAGLRGLPPDPWPALSMLRDLTEAVRVTARRLYGLPDDEEQPA